MEASVDDVDCSATLPGAIGWLKYTIDNELLMNQIGEASKRISALLAGAKQYSQMDRAEYQKVNVHELIFSTVKTIFGDKVGKDKPVNLVWEKDKSLPELSCYPGDLNQVWTNIIDNAIQAMGGHGTLTIRTAWESESTIRVEIGDDGPGIPEDIIDRISALLAGAKQYSQMDRAPYQSANVHELLRSTVMMFGDKIGQGKPVLLCKELDHSLPELLCYPGDLNQVFTNIIDNALQAMGKSRRWKFGHRI